MNRPRCFGRTYRCNEEFPVVIGERMLVRENGKIAEIWEVVKTTRRSFTVFVTELMPEWRD